MKNRIGIFEAAEELVHECDEGLRAVMAQCTVIASHYYKEKRIYKYKAVSPMFDEVDEGGIVPGYTAIATREHDGKLSVKFVMFEEA